MFKKTKAVRRSYPTKKHINKTIDDHFSPLETIIELNQPDNCTIMATPTTISDSSECYTPSKKKKKVFYNTELIIVILLTILGGTPL